MTTHWDDCWQVHQDCARERAKDNKFLIMLRRQKRCMNDIANITGLSQDTIGKRLRRAMDSEEYKALKLEISPRKTGLYTVYPMSERLKRAFEMRENYTSIQDICNKLGFDLGRLAFTMKEHYGEERYAELAKKFKNRYFTKRKKSKTASVIKFNDTFGKVFCKEWAPEFEGVE